MLNVVRSAINRALALIGDVCALKFWGAGVEGTVDEGDGHSFAGVALLACCVEVVVGEVLL